MENTKIEWATHSWNPWIGCTEVGPACDNCYARVLMADRYGRAEWGAGNPRVRTSEATRKLPYRWNRSAAQAGRHDTVFCLSLGDIWDNEVDPAWRAEIFDVAEATQNLIYLFLSKRIGNAAKMTAELGRRLPPNVALGATMVNQVEWDRDCGKLLDAASALGARFTFASVEPMLGAIVIFGSARPDWIICGGESGPGARMIETDWARNLRDQCAATGTAFFMKQMTRKAAIPADLMIREFPRAA